MNPINRFFRRVLPKDSDSTDRPGAFGVYFEGPLYWFFEGCFEYHDEMYERIAREETDLTHLQADVKFLECLRKKLRLNRNELTGAQYRWAKLCVSSAWMVCRALNTLRGDK